MGRFRTRQKGVKIQETLDHGKEPCGPAGLALKNSSNNGNFLSQRDGRSGCCHVEAHSGDVAHLATTGSGYGSRDIGSRNRYPFGNTARLFQVGRQVRHYDRYGEQEIHAMGTDVKME